MVLDESLLTDDSPIIVCTNCGLKFKRLYKHCKLNHKIRHQNGCNTVAGNSTTVAWYCIIFTSYSAAVYTKVASYCTEITGNNTMKHTFSQECSQKSVHDHSQISQMRLERQHANLL